ncbi:hypothetical protein JTE90_006071 [Oedothorax gibbosus]|uniref:PDZ domain-containing protein n=1 Tax=Oedothorax gibbosus TaxID=931172 RepID=A0AAV6V6L7_9ARAC|nr:hypothetical protein JTE90_006071 [Oedothorax gibbosus]
MVDRDRERDAEERCPMGEERRGGGYAIVVAQAADRKIKLFGCPSGRFEGESGSDEIWEVNGRLLESWTVREVRHFLQRCVHSRTLCLRIKPDKCREKGPKSINLISPKVVFEKCFPPEIFNSSTISNKPGGAYKVVKNIWSV